MLKQFMRPVLGLWMVGLLFLTVNSTAFAQLSPPLSPWLGMQDRNRSPGQLDPYNRVVKPQQDMMRTLAAQSGQMQSQQQALQLLQGGSGGSTGTNVLLAGVGESQALSKDMLLQPPREIPSKQNPAGFNQYLHYYPPRSLPNRQAPYFSQVGRRW